MPDHRLGRRNDPFWERAAERAFLAEAEAAARHVRWFLRTALAVTAAYMLAITWLVPGLAPEWLRHVANGLHGLLPAWFAAGDAPVGTLARQHVGATGIVCLIAIPIATAGYAMTWSSELAKGYTVADDLLPHPFLRLPGHLMAAVVVAGLSWVQDLAVLWWLAGIIAVEAAAELLTRLLMARGGRLRLAARLLGRGVRSRALAGAVAVAVLLAVSAVWSPWDHPASDIQPVQPRSDPNVIAADAEVEQAYRASLPESVAASDLVRMHRLWQTGRLFEADAAAALRADAAFRDQIKALGSIWQTARARRFTAQEIRASCDPMGGAASCQTTQTGLIDAGAGPIMFRLTAPDYAALLGLDANDRTETIVQNNAVDLFHPVGDDRRQLVLHASFDAGEPGPPTLVESPRGPLLVIPAGTSVTLDATQVYTAGQDGGWQWLDTEDWLQQAAAALPDQACLLHTLYIGKRPMFTGLHPDYQSLTVGASFGPDPGGADRTALGRLELQFDIQGHALVVSHADVTVFPQQGWLTRLFAARPRC
ncbi:MAG: hypothetical protein ACRYHQ_15045 [Janthinobacterium lividum]